MKKTTTIDIIIPTFNEKDNIPVLLPLIHEILEPLNYDYQIIVVDDDSPDETWRIAEEYADTLPVKVIRRISEKGLSSAVMEGFKQSRGGIVGVMDADLSHPPDRIPFLIEAVTTEGYDMAVGSRLCKGGKVEVWPIHRKLLSFGGRVLARPLTPVKDIMSGFFFLKKSVIEGVEIIPRGYKIGLEILVKGNSDKITEIPITFRNRDRGESKLGMKIYAAYLVQLADLYKHTFLTSKNQ